jgi:palmitoyl-protein thioesterase
MKKPQRPNDIYTGLRALDEKGRLMLDEAPGEHMHFSLDWFIESVVLKYLS